MGVQCYEIFGGIALKIHTFSFSLVVSDHMVMVPGIIKLGEVLLILHLVFRHYLLTATFCNGDLFFQ